MTNTSSTKKTLQNKPLSSKLLLSAAWLVQILAAGLGLMNAWVIAIKTRLSLEDNIASFTGDIDIKTTIMIAVLPFVAIAILELTKIPMAMGFYYSKKVVWKTILLISLIALIVITFETNVTTLERNYTVQKVASELSQDLANRNSLESLLVREVEELEHIKSEIDELNITLNSLRIEEDLAMDSMNTGLADLTDVYNDMIQTELELVERIESLKRQLTAVKNKINKKTGGFQIMRLAAIIYSVEPAKITEEQVNLISTIWIVLVALFFSLIGILLAIASFVLANRAKNFTGQ